MNRRELLKFFGAGTIITPLVASAPMARIIEPPKVELFKEVPKAFMMSDVVSVSVRFKMADGTVHERASKSIGTFAGMVKPGDDLQCAITAGYLASPYAYKGFLEANL